MKISCTVKEFGQIVRGCEKASCYQCPISEVCGGDKGSGIERFVSAEDVIAEPETGGVSDG